MPAASIAADKIGKTTVSYNSDQEKAGVSVAGTFNGHAFHLSLHVHVSTPGDLRESEVKAIVNAETKKLLRRISDSL